MSGYPSLNKQNMPQQLQRRSSPLCKSMQADDGACDAKTRGKAACNMQQPLQ